MKESYKPLLTPWKIGKVELKNRKTGVREELPPEQVVSRLG